MRRLKKHNQRGVALIMVLSTVTLVTTVVAEFQYNTHVDLQLAYNSRDALQAEYNALSALKLRALMLRQSRQIQSAVKGLLGSTLGDAIPPIGQILEMIPVECGLMSTITRVAGRDLDDDEDAEAFFPGECIATSESEHSKIAINSLGSVSENNTDRVLALVGLLSDPSLERHFQEDDRNGVHAETPLELVGAIVDWVDIDSNQAMSPVSDEDRFYDYVKPSYEAKNAPFDSVQELQMVHGVDDELFELLRKHVTIYSTNSKIELATADRDRIWLGLLSLTFPGIDRATLLDHPGIQSLEEVLDDLTTLGGAGFATLTVDVLKTLVDQAGLSSVIDVQKIPLVFKDGSGTMWFTIRAEGLVGNVSRKIRAVFQAQEGKFFYFRYE